MTDEERKKQPKKRVQCELHCRECGKLLGKYDAEVGIKNVTFYCRKCRRERTYTIPPRK